MMPEARAGHSAVNFPVYNGQHANMTGISMEAFDQFVLDRKQDLRRIARHTQGEHQYGDVINEAWVMAETLSARQSIFIDFRDAAFQKLLLSHLYQHLVRYTDLKVRRAVRLDHATSNDAEAGQSHPLLNQLISDGGKDPLWHLIASEGESNSPRHSGDHHSLAGAYLMLLRRFDNKMHSVANHLLISLSHTYRCCAKARWLALHQQAIALTFPETAFCLRPWRRYRMSRVPRQYAFDFEDSLPLNAMRAEPA